MMEILLKKRSLILAILLTVASFITIFTGACKNEKAVDKLLKVEHAETKSGNTYTIFHKGELAIDFSMKRPEKTDENILLCIAGAFTGLESGQVDGLYIDHGNIQNKS